MLRALQSELELVVQRGFLYVPLLLDPDIEGEVRAGFSGEPKMVIESGGRRFIRSLGMESLLASYERVDGEIYEQVAKNTLLPFSAASDEEMVSPLEKIRTILLRIMPYFIRKNTGFERRRHKDEEVLDLVCSKVEVPRRFLAKADEVLDFKPLVQRLKALDERESSGEPPPEGPVTGEALRQWIRKALEAQILDREKARLRQEIHERERIGEAKRLHTAMLLYMAERGSFELDGFGFERMGAGDEYLVYKRTGEYILKDYYDRSYRFPDCRVAVPTTRPFRPLVIESYKHPFLLHHAPRQEICIRGYEWPDELTPDNIIRLLEEGINALQYGYDPRRRNGYHSLDPTLYYVKTIEFQDYLV